MTPPTLHYVSHFEPSVGATGGVYERDEDVTLLVDRTLAWSTGQWQRQSEQSRAAGEVFCADRALVPLLEDWRSLGS